MGTPGASSAYSDAITGDSNSIISFSSESPLQTAALSHVFAALLLLGVICCLLPLLVSPQRATCVGGDSAAGADRLSDTSAERLPGRLSEKLTERSADRLSERSSEAFSEGISESRAGREAASAVGGEAPGDGQPDGARRRR